MLGLGLCAFLAMGVGIYASPKAEETYATAHADNYDNYVYDGDYYAGISGTNGLDGTLRSALSEKITPASYPTYSGNGADHLAELLQEADEDPDNSSNMVYFYTRDSLAKNAASSWNREHVWPQSLSGGCWGTDKAGADLLHIRPTYNTTNSKRGNLKYGDCDGGTTQTYNGITYGKTTSSYFEPIDAVKGDCARIIMYVWTAYVEEYSALPEVTNVFESYDTLLEWHTEDPPDELEGHRNDYAESSLQKNRNPFVDHPEYAWMVFGEKASSSVLASCEETYPSDGSWANSIASLKLSSSSLSLKVGESASLVATSSDGSGISWSASDETMISFTDGSTSSSGSAFSFTALKEGSVTLKAEATIEGNTISKECAITIAKETADDSSSEEGTKLGSITYGDLATAYEKSDTAHVSSDGQIAFSAYYCANFSSRMQWKKSLGYLYNTSAIALKRIVINDPDGGTLSVYGGTSAKPSEKEIALQDGSYDLSGYSYFIVKAGSNASYASSIAIYEESAEPETIAISGVALDISEASLQVGESIQLTASVSPSDASNKNITWSSSDQTVASVSNEGLVTAVKEGSASVSVTTEDGGYQASCLITVLEPASSSSSLDESSSEDGASSSEDDSSPSSSEGENDSTPVSSSSSEDKTPSSSEEKDSSSESTATSSTEGDINATHEGGFNQTALLVVGVASAAILAVVIIAIVLLKRRKNK